MTPTLSFQRAAFARAQAMPPAARCPRCNGLGYRIHTWGERAVIGYEIVVWRELRDCERCGGDGERRSDG